MIPIRLEIQGLYSYQEKQIVEFDALTGAGLFGIFGAVGSGKSSILEAILLALYGSTERLSDRGEKSSMLNLQSSQLLIQLEFRSGKNNTAFYKARYAAKRNKKDPEKVEPAEHTFYQQISGNWEPLEARAEEIIGMKKEHFKQTVIIPQGKFREFIDLTPGPRAEMMKELFGLERFDLSQKTGSLLKIEKENRIRLETQLAALVDFSSDNLEASKHILEDITQKIEGSIFDLNKREKELKTLDNQSQKHADLLKFQVEKAELEIKKPNIERNRILHKDFITAKSNLKPTWDNLNTCRTDLEKATVSAEDCTRFAIRYEKEVAKLEQEEIDLKKKNLDRPKREAKIRDLKKVAEIKDLRQSLESAEKKVETIKPEIALKKEDQSKLEKRIKELESQLRDFDELDSDQLSELKIASREWEQLKKQETFMGQGLKELKSTEDQINREIKKLKVALPEKEISLQSWLEAQKKELKELESDREKLITKQGLVGHVHLLQAGEACPLCGSQEHPNPLQAEEDEQEVASLNHRIEVSKKSEEETYSLIQKEKELEIRLENLKGNLKEKDQDLSNNLEAISALKRKLLDFAISDQESLTQLIQELDQAAQVKSSLTKEIRGLRSNWDSQRESLETLEKTFNQAFLVLQAKETAIATKKEEIKDPTFCKPYYEKSLDEIHSMVQKVEKNISEAIELLEGKQKILREKRACQSTNLADLKNFEHRKEELSKKLEELKVNFEKLKIEFNFPDDEALIRLFEQSIDAEKIDLEIRQFDQKLGSVNERIQELENEAGVAKFDETRFLAKKEEYTSLKSRHELLQQESTLLQQNIKETKLKLTEKEALEKKLAKLDIRESYLKELERLFKGSGFVKYVSSIYLKELCHTANIRFMKLSKNSLSLEIDEDNTFWVIDYLNGGKRRLLKTLSGGQTFQASLCLALALAEKVKSLNRADQSFFFMDEGFGALDKGSLRVVFETLKSLRHENRIVGIISHVEDLQQEIGVFAKVELDAERGSQVSYSY